MVGTTDKVSDAHVDVVDNDAELIHRLAEVRGIFARTQQNEILDLVVREFALTEYCVEKFRGPTHRNFETNRRLPVLRGGPAIAARTAHDPADLPCGSAFDGMIASNVTLRRAIAPESAAVRQKLLPRLTI